MKNSQTYKDINYFNINELSIEKKRELDVKNTFGAGARKNKLLQIIHKKMASPEGDLFKNKGSMFNLF